jgi:hypothetical protein
MRASSEDRPAAIEAIQRQEAKKGYVPPRLREYGSIAKLTQNGNGSGNDGGTGTMMMVCL